MYPHQEDAVKWAQNKEFAALFLETGTGKTMVALELFQQWVTINNARIIVVCMNNLTENWVLEGAKWDYPFRMVRCHGTKTQRLKIISGEWDVLSINYESLRNPEILAAIKATNPKGVCFDEMHHVKDRRAKQTKAARELAACVRANGGKCIGLTGTPVVHSPPDLWSEFDVLHPGATPKEHPLGYGNFYAFEQGVADIRPHPRLGFRVKIYTYPDYKLGILKSRVAPHAFEASKDLLNLPPRTFLPPIEIAMGDEQAKIYKALKEDYIAFLGEVPPPTGALERLAEWGVSPLEKNGIARSEWSNPALMGEGLDKQVSTTFATTLLVRLQQITSGFIKTDDGQIRELPNAKIDWLHDELPGLTDKTWDNKCVIFCRFKYDVARLSMLCEQLKIGYVSLSGKNSGDAAKVQAKFWDDPETRVFIGNLAVSSTGLNLQIANNCVFYSNTLSGEHRAQATDRVYRIGQKRKVFYYDLLCRGTVDRRILKNLTEKDEIAAKTVRNLMEMIQ